MDIQEIMYFNYMQRAELEAAAYELAIVNQEESQVHKFIQEATTQQLQDYIKTMSNSAE